MILCELEKKVLHGPNADFVNIVRIDETTFKLKISYFSDLSVDIEESYLYFLYRGDEVRLKMERNTANNHVWSSQLVWKGGESSLFSYRFKILVNKNELFFDSSGVYKYCVANSKNFKIYPAQQIEYLLWAKSSFIYHIFLDRFNLVGYINPANAEWLTAPDQSAYQFFGGNLDGITSKAEYLYKLGCRIVLLSPIFKSSTNHRYDTESYKEVDAKLGGEIAILKMLSRFKELGIRVLFDGVFNHTSNECEWFLNEARGTYKGSMYKTDGDIIQCFWGDPKLPIIDYASELSQERMFGSSNSVVKYWLKPPYGVSGWRLDASSMIGRDDFIDSNKSTLQQIYISVKNENADALIIGEEPFDPSEIKPFIHMDGITNYSGFYTPVLYWFSRKNDFSTKDLDFALKDFVSIMGLQFSLLSMTFLDNHDKPRFIGILNGDNYVYVNSLVLLFMSVGVPVIYYGDEIGLCDKNIPNDSRICMNWQERNADQNKIIDITSKLAVLKLQSQALRYGITRSIYVGNDIYAFVREYGHDIIIVLVSRASKWKATININTYVFLREYPSKMYLYLHNNEPLEAIKNSFLNISIGAEKFPLILTSMKYKYNE